MDVRPATPDDADAVAALVHAAYRSEESRQGWTSEAHLVGGQRADAEMVRRLVTAPGSVVLVGTAARPAGDPGAGVTGADSTAAPAGAARAELLACCHLERRPGSAYLGMFAVRPRLQGQGAGRTMLRAAETHARDVWGASALEITVLNHRPELMAWYERCGFLATGEEHPFPYGDERFGRPHRDDLVLCAMTKGL